MDGTTPTTGARFGAWTLIGIDPLGKRITARCDCGAIWQLGIGALEAGDTLGCGCALTPRPKRSPRSTFAAKDEEIADLKRQIAAQDIEIERLTEPLTAPSPALVQ